MTFEIGDIVKVLTAIGGPTSVVALYKWAVSHGKREALAEQTKATLTAKDEEIAELKAENQRLWSIMDSLTHPPGEVIMRHMLHSLHDVWCAVTGRCRIRDDKDPLIQILRSHERAARIEAEASRRRQHFLEADLMGRLEQNGGGDDRSH